MMIFSEYKPKHSESLLKYEGDIIYAREYYEKYKPTNLTFLLKKRYEWMNQYIKKGDKVLEVGCGPGFAKEFLRKDCKLLLTDFVNHPLPHWIDQKIDALNTGFKDNTFDVLIASNMIHHVPYPKKFFIEMGRILKPNGFLLIQDVNLSTGLILILRSLKFEGWSYKADVFSVDKPCTDEKDLWSGNNAMINLLFDNREKFKNHIPFFEIKHHKYSEFFIFLLSGGVIAKAKTINLPYSILKLVDKVDEFLVFTAPKIFALQSKIVLVKLK